MAVLCVFLATACGFDYHKRKIPNWLILIMLGVGFWLRCMREGGSGGLAYLGAMLLVTAFLYPFFKIGALGAGDVKLFGVTAGYLPFEKILYFSFCSMLIAAVFSVCKVICKKRGKECLTVCLSGPVLLGALLLWGGVY